MADDPAKPPDANEPPTPPTAAADNAQSSAPAEPAARPPAAAGGAEHAPKAAPPSGPADQAPPAGATPPAFIATLQATIAGSVSQISYWVGDWTLIVPLTRLLEVARHLREAPDTAFDMCSDVTASDWPSRAERF